MGNGVDWIKGQTVIGDVDEWVNEQTVVGDMTTWMDDQGMEWLQYVVPVIAAEIMAPGSVSSLLASASTTIGKTPLIGKYLAAPVELAAEGAWAAENLAFGSGSTLGGYASATGQLGPGTSVAAEAGGLGGTALRTAAASEITGDMSDYLNNANVSITDFAKEQAGNFKWYDEGLGQIVAANLISLPFSLAQAYGQAAIADQFAPETTTQTRTTRTTFEKPLPEISLPRYPTGTETTAPSLEAGATEGTVLPSAGLTARASEIPTQEDISKKVRPRSQAEMAGTIAKELMASATPENRTKIKEKLSLLFAGLGDRQLPNRRGLG